MEDNLTPADTARSSEPVNTTATAEAGQPSEFTPKIDASLTPNRTVYVGNLYYQVTPEQLQRVFSRFGEIDTVKIVYDNRGLSRG